MSPPETPDTSFKSGFVSIIGAPNVGKSTLLNRILGEKISITSAKPQTTRNRILGVVHRPQAQIVFMDTPGIHDTRDLLNKRMLQFAYGAMEEADAVLLMVDAANPHARAEEFLTRSVRRFSGPVVLALNKIDLIKDVDILTALDRWKTVLPFRDMVPISALSGLYHERLLERLEACLPFGPPYFPEDALTDLPSRFIAAEMIREKVFEMTQQEIPYATAVTVERFKEEKEGRLIRIHATIHLERASQKGIVIGKHGSMLKRIGESARKDIQRMVGAKVYLQLFVHVQKNWSKDTKALRKFGYE